MNKPKNSLKGKIKSSTEEGYKKTKKVAKKVKEKTKKTTGEIKKEYNSPRGKKVREWIKKTSNIVGSHLATMKAGVTLSNEEAELMEKIKETLNKKGVYPSKSEILRAGLWNLRKMKSKELEEVIKDLFKVKQTRVL